MQLINSINPAAIHNRRDLAKVLRMLLADRIDTHAGNECVITRADENASPCEDRDPDFTVCTDGGGVVYRVAVTRFSDERGQYEPYSFDGEGNFVREPVLSDEERQLVAFWRKLGVTPAQVAYRMGEGFDPDNLDDKEMTFDRAIRKTTRIMAEDGARPVILTESANDDEARPVIDTFKRIESIAEFMRALEFLLTDRLGHSGSVTESGDDGELGFCLDEVGDLMICVTTLEDYIRDHPEPADAQPKVFDDQSVGIDALTVVASRD